jgi:hypothetical protein
VKNSLTILYICLLNGTDGSDVARIDEELRTNSIPLNTNFNNNKQDANKIVLQYKDKPSNFIDNNTELPKHNQKAHTFHSQNQKNNEYSKLHNTEEIAADKPLAMMLTNRRKPLAYSGLNFGIFGVVVYRM